MELKFAEISLKQAQNATETQGAQRKILVGHEFLFHLRTVKYYRYGPIGIIFTLCLRVIFLRQPIASGPYSNSLCSILLLAISMNSRRQVESVDRLKCVTQLTADLFGDKESS